MIIYSRKLCNIAISLLNNCILHKNFKFLFLLLELLCSNLIEKGAESFLLSPSFLEIVDKGHSLLETWQNFFNLILLIGVKILHNVIWI